MRAFATTLVRELHSPEKVFRKWQGPYTVVAAWLGLLLAIITPPHGTGSTVCWIKQCTGIPCLGCGLGHSLSCGLRGMFADSLNYHPFGLFILALFLFTATVSVFPPARRRVAVYMESHPVLFNVFYLAFVSAFVAFGSIRALLEILHRAPL
jgi:Protein of unknown function (DUF2752)